VWLHEADGLAIVAGSEPSVAVRRVGALTGATRSTISMRAICAPWGGEQRPEQYATAASSVHSTPPSRASRERWWPRRACRASIGAASVAWRFDYPRKLVLALPRQRWGGQQGAQLPDWMKSSTGVIRRRTSAPGKAQPHRSLRTSTRCGASCIDRKTPVFTFPCPYLHCLRPEKAALRAGEGAPARQPSHLELAYYFFRRFGSMCAITARSCLMPSRASAVCSAARTARISGPPAFSRSCLRETVIFAISDMSEFLC
jgi:hypothetical protein